MTADRLLDTVVYELEELRAGADERAVALSVIDLVQSTERDRIIADLVRGLEGQVDDDALELAVHAVRGTL